MINGRNYKLGDSYYILMLFLYFALSQMLRFFSFDFGGVSASGYIISIFFLMGCFVFYLIYNKVSTLFIISLFFFIVFFVFLYYFYGGDFKYFIQCVVLFLVAAIIFYILSRVEKWEYFLNGFMFFLGCYCFGIFLLTAITIFFSGNVSDVLVTLIKPVTYLHSDGSELYKLHHNIRPEAIFLGRGPREYVFDGVQFALYPFIYLMLRSVFGDILKNSFAGYVFFFCSIFVVLCYNSRTMILSILLINLYVFFDERTSLVRYLRAFRFLIILLIFSAPFIPLIAMSEEALRGRSELYGLIFDGFNAFGNGFGASIRDVKEVTGFLGSMHNIHFEFIYNFGLIVYIVMAMYIMLRFSVNRYFISIAIFTNVYMATNGNLLDYYWVYFVILVIVAQSKLPNSIKS